ncbi:MAG TPA: sigma-54-dependent Fis family transcriptional regulator [Deltaproteobacteria bacterium]|nr:MAG: Nitrogen fixation protein VnfA [Deltaproteobacteria bacterium ADurb.Bin072]HNQ84904.1 sigma-54-dependent Fis family transcriptional regulator [Deltaproteobacteria bacterium]HRW80137.1 sigma-54-dependent Fis family transcriptional regulator [Desulfomonilia bacterium]HNS88762.1 sigma-54-dependent Fis family transcriptional regulator [Deltaproteobacteria bacterium]HOA43614.1 sigma-54-dependent Fis family transcriptional regulator [Deltaproteobacteria bacterium]
MQEPEKMQPKRKILVVDDEESIRYTFSHFLKEAGYEVFTASDLKGARKILFHTRLDLVFLDIVLGAESGLDLLKQLKSLLLKLPVVMITGKPTLDNATDALRRGAFDFLIKPVRKDDLLRAAALAISHKALIDEKELVTREKEKYRTNLEAIFQSVNDAIITVDETMRVIDANRQIETISGMSVRKVVGKAFDDCFTRCSHNCSKVIRETLKSKKPIRELRMECEHHERPRQVVLLSCSPLTDDAGTFMGAVLVVRDITRLHDLEEELRDRSRFHNIIGRSGRVQSIFRLVEALSDLDTTVLVTGESGTGKELVANALHYSGKRAKRPFVKVNCAALAENLLESELFGHVKGAFTGAIRDKQGRFELAKDGTILLDEIGDIPPRIQAKLLRVLEARTYERVGDAVSRKVDARVIASTNRNLRDKVKSGEFREDLYYRLNVVEISLPPMRERLEDIPLLVEHFCTVFEGTFGKIINGVSEEVMRLFLSYPWPGNVRELEHAIEHAFVLCNDRIILPEHLPPYMLGPVQKVAGTGKKGDEAGLILDILTQTDWNIAKAARMLSMSRPTLYRKMREHGIEKQGEPG